MTKHAAIAMKAELAGPVGLALLVFSGTLSTCYGQSDGCAELSYQRNSIFKQAGYCFKTSAQIRIFGNARCQYDEQADVPLSERDRIAVARIVREERILGCR